MAAVNTTIAKVAPGMGDWMAEKQADRQHYDEPPRDPDGTLYHAGETGQIHGQGAAVRK
jgi:hypothetical protein